MKAYEKTQWREKNLDGTYKATRITEYVGNGWTARGEGLSWDEANEKALEQVWVNAPENVATEINGKRRFALDKKAYNEMSQAERDAHNNL